MTTDLTPKPRDIAYEMLEERISYLQLLKSFHDEIVKIIRIYTSSESFTSERCLQEIINFIRKKFDIYLVDIFLLDEMSRELILYVTSSEDGVDPHVKNFRINLNQGLTGHCAKTGETLMVNDVTKDPRFLPGPFPKAQSELCVPLKIKHRIVGVLDLEDKVKNRFKRDFVELLEDIALNIGFALENKQLYDELKSYNEQLEKKVESKVAELKKSEEKYRAIVENATDPIFITDIEGHFTWVNRATCGLLGYLQPEIMGMNISRVLKKGNMHKLYNAIRDACEGKDVKTFQIELVTKSGEDRIVEFACTGARENGSINGLEVTLRDITEKTIVEKLKKNYTKTLEDAVAQRTAEIKDTQRASILAIANLAESIDDDTGGHIQRIQHYAKLLAQDLQRHSKYKEQITDEYCELIFDLSPLHDLGKVGIRDYILQKTDKLTEEEFEKMKEHTEIGAHALRMAGEMIHRESLFSIGEMIARFHHEKWDGTGYPAVDIGGEHRPLKADEIPLCARLVALADVYDALCSKRPYKMPFPHERARDMIVAQKGKHFDPEVVDAFLRVENDFIRVRSLFPDTLIPDGKPFELPARDRV